MTSVPNHAAAMFDPLTRFYGAPPIDYFHQRLSNLVLVSQLPERLELGEDEELKVGVIQLGKASGTDEEEKKKTRPLCNYRVPGPSPPHIRNAAPTLLRAHARAEGSAGSTTD